MKGEGAIKFFVEDSIKTNYPLERLIVSYTEESSRKTYSDTVVLIPEQRVNVCYLSPGTYTMYIRNGSFLDYEMTEIIVREDRLTFIKIELERKTNEKKKTQVKYQPPVVTKCG